MHVDRQSHRWWKETIGELTDNLFGFVWNSHCPQWLFGRRIRERHRTVTLACAVHPAVDHPLIYRLVPWRPWEHSRVLGDNGWMVFVSALTWDEWQQLDLDLQRLYVLLDYIYDEDGGSWHRVVRNPKYAVWVAKVTVYTMMQYGLLEMESEDEKVL